MEGIIDYIGSYLAGHAEVAVFLCLSLGYLAGRLRIGSFTLGATVGTLLVSLLVGQLTAFSIPDQVKSTFFIMFSFVLGYESGPAFFANLRTTGLRAVLLAVFFAAATFLASFGAAKLMGFDPGTIAGLTAGAQTQSSILGVTAGNAEAGAAATVAYALTYIFGTVGVTVFVKNIAPALMHVNLRQAVKARADAMGGPDLREQTTQAAAVQVRAYTIEAASVYAGMTIAQAEAQQKESVQISRLFRQEQELPVTEDTVLCAGDVISVIGRAHALNHFDDNHLTETTQDRYLQLSLTRAELIVTAEDPGNALALLDRGGVLLTGVIRRGKSLTPEAAGSIRPGDHLLLHGPTAGVRQAVQALGYVRDTGDAADIPFFGLAIALGVILGSFFIKFNSVPLALGAGGGALLLGLVCGQMYHRNPRRGYIPSGARWFLRSVGLNLFVAVTALNAARHLGPALGWHCIPLVLTGAAVTLIPHVAAMYFGRYVLKMDPVDVLGALCGAGTCTAALNALSEDTDSAAFASSYSPACAVGNILLTIVGILVFLLA